MKKSAAFLCLMGFCFASPCCGVSPPDRLLFTGGSQIQVASGAAAPERSPRIRPDGWFAQDKADHFFTSAMLACSAYLALRATHNDVPTAFVSSLSGTLTIGVCKEIWDVFHPGTPSWKDLTADVLGTLLGIASACTMTAE